jgi:hypothetical protein
MNKNLMKVTKNANQPRGGLKGSSHGNFFQFGTTELFTLRLYQQNSDFEIDSETQGSGKFDDCIIKIGDQQFFLQAKHKEDTNNKITEDNLLKKKGGLNLSDYYLSYLEISHAKQFDSCKKHFYIYTNNGVQQTGDENKILYYLKLIPHKENILKLNGKIYKFNSEQHERIKIILGEEFQQITAMDHLGFALANAIIKNLTIDDTTELFRLNQSLLTNYVFDLKSKQFSNTFLSSKEKYWVRFKDIISKRYKIILRNDGITTDNMPELKDMVLNISDSYTTLTPSSKKFKYISTPKDDISGFLNNFYLALKHPDKNDLDKLILDIVKKLKPKWHDLKSIENIFRIFFVNWVRSTESKPLTNMDIENILNSAKIVDIAPNLVGLIKANKRNLKELNLEYITKDTNGDTLEWFQTISDFMENDNEQIKILSSQKNEMLLNTCKVFQVLRAIKNRDDWIYLTSNNIIRYFDDISNALKLYQKIFIFQLKKDMHEELKKLRNLISGKSKNKIVFIMEADLPSSQSNSFENLSVSSKEHVRTKMINFQGTEIELRQILYNEEVEMHVPLEILTKKALYTINLPEKFELSDGFYTNRTLAQIDKWKFFSDNKLLNQNKITLISDVAGMGKTSLLNELAKQLRKENPYDWVLFLKLNDFSKEFQIELKKSNFDHSDGKEWVSFLAKSILGFPEDSFKSIAFKKSILSIGNCHILIDAFDEICPNYEAVVMEMIVALTKTKIKSMFVSTRPQKRQELEKKLNVMAFEFKPFDEPDQIKCLKQIWKNELDHTKAEKLVEILKTSFKYSNMLVTGIPLHIKMIGEILQNNEIDLRDCFENFDIHFLYQKFVEKKHFLHLTEKRKLDDSNVGFDDHLNDLNEKFKSVYFSLALTTLFNEEQLKILQLNPENKFPKDTEAIGIIQKRGGKYEFIHRTFAEYFASNFFYEKLNDESVATYFFTDILSYGRYDVLQSFFNAKLKHCGSLENVAKDFSNSLSKIDEKQLSELYCSSLWRAFDNNNLNTFTLIARLLPNNNDAILDFFKKILHQTMCNINFKFTKFNLLIDLIKVKISSQNLAAIIQQAQNEWSDNKRFDYLKIEDKETWQTFLSFARNYATNKQIMNLIFNRNSKFKPRDPRTFAIIFSVFKFDDNEEFILKCVDIESIFRTENFNYIKTFFDTLSLNNVDLLQICFGNKIPYRMFGHNILCTIVEGSFYYNQEPTNVLEYLLAKDSNGLIKSFLLKKPFQRFHFKNNSMFKCLCNLFTSNEVLTFIFEWFDITSEFNNYNTLNFFETLSFYSISIEKFLQTYFDYKEVCTASGYEILTMAYHYRHSPDVFDFLLRSDTKEFIRKYITKKSVHGLKFSRVSFLSLFCENLENVEKFIFEYADMTIALCSDQYERTLKFLNYLVSEYNIDMNSFLQRLFNSKNSCTLIEKTPIPVLEFMISHDSNECIKKIILEKPMQRLKIVKTARLDCLCKLFLRDEIEQFIIECVDIVDMFKKFVKIREIEDFFNILSKNKIQVDEFLQICLTSHTDIGIEFFEIVCKNYFMFEFLIKYDSQGSIKNFIMKKRAQKLKIRCVDTLVCLCNLLSSSSEIEKLIFGNVDISLFFSCYRNCNYKSTCNCEPYLEFMKFLNSNHNIDMDMFIQLCFGQPGNVKVGIDLIEKASSHFLSYMISQDLNKLIKKFILEQTPQSLKINGDSKLECLCKILNQNEVEKFLFESLDIVDWFRQKNVFEKKRSIFFVILRRNKIDTDKFYQRYFHDNVNLGNDILKAIFTDDSTEILEDLLANDTKNLCKNFILKRPEQKFRIETVHLYFWFFKFFSAIEIRQFIFECVDITFLLKYTNKLNEFFYFFEVLFDNGISMDTFIKNYAANETSQTQSLLKKVCEERYLLSVLDFILNKCSPETIKFWLFMEQNEKLEPFRSLTFICIQEHLGNDDFKRFISKIVDIEKIKKLYDSYKINLQRILVEVGSDIDIFHS